MKKRQFNAFDAKAIKDGHYAVICTAITKAQGHSITYEQFLEHLKRVWRDLTKHNSTKAGAMVVLDEMPEIYLKLVAPMKTQGALIALDDEHGSTGTGTSVAPPAYAPLDRQGNSPLEASAIAEAEEIARTCARLAKGAIDAADVLIKRAEQESLSIESASSDFAGSPDEKITRETYGRAQGPEQKLSFSGDVRILGGRHTTPKLLHSKATFELTQCKVAISRKNNCCHLHGHADDPEWQRLIKWSGYMVDELDGDATSDEMYLLRLAEVSNQLVDVDVCVTEKPSSKKRRLMPIRVRNRAAIRLAINERLEVIGDMDMP